MPPYVLKADGLAAGKGVLIIEDLEEAKEALKDTLENDKFGSAGSRVVIEEFLQGQFLGVDLPRDAVRPTLFRPLPKHAHRVKAHVNCHQGECGQIRDLKQ